LFEGGNVSKCCRFNPKIPLLLYANLKASLKRRKVLKNLRNSRLIAILPILLATIAVLSFTPLAHAYGAANWQVAFSGTFAIPGSGNGGFWGWCDFAGGTGTPATSGTSADCQISQYFGPGHAIQVEESISGTAWSEGPCHFPPCVTPTDFFITDGAMTLSGPTVVQMLPTIGSQLQSLGCTISGNTVTCSLSIWEILPPGCSPGNCIYSPDTGIPTKAGHFNLNSVIGQVGELQVQVVQVS
jgi:hypothetical protein